MKNYLMCLLSFSLLVSCGDTSNYLSEFPGTYIRTINEKVQEGTSVTGNDTIVVQKMGEGENFKVTRSKRLKKILDNVKQPDDYDVKNWVATYSQSNKSLTVVQTGNVITLDLSTNKLFLGTTEFKKLN